jgi:hypothetical protein
MCRLCKIASENSEYLHLLEEMQYLDKRRMESSKDFLEQFPSLNSSMYTSLKWPAKISSPLFEARAAFAVPHNYFQKLYLDSEPVGNHFAQGATRSIFFSGKKLVVLSKTMGQETGRPFLSSFLFTHFGKDEYEFRYDGKDLRISVDAEKRMKNLVTKKVEKKAIKFTFVHQSLEGRIMSKQQAVQSAYVKRVYGSHGRNVNSLFASSDLEGYVVSVAHISPHPFMLRLHEDFGFGSNRHFQENVMEYFSAHLGFTFERELDSEESGISEHI